MIKVRKIRINTANKYKKQKTKQERKNNKTYTRKIGGRPEPRPKVKEMFR